MKSFRKLNTATGLVLALGATAAWTGTAFADPDDNRGRGPRVFYLTGSAVLDRDPENPANEVIEFTANSATGEFSGITRFFNHPREKTKLRDLDNQLESRHRFEAPDSCGGGSPRMQIAIDLNGDDRSDGNAFGYFGTFPNFTGCPSETWLYEDFTGGDGITGLGPEPSTGLPSRGEQNGGPSEEREWDVSQLTGAGELVIAPPLNATQLTWSDFETALDQFRRSRVCQVSYIDDVGAGVIFTPAETDGVSHADLISIGDETLNGSDDVAGRFRGGQDPCRVRSSNSGGKGKGKGYR